MQLSVGKGVTKKLKWQEITTLFFSRSDRMMLQRTATHLFQAYFAGGGPPLVVVPFWHGKSEEFNPLNCLLLEEAEKTELVQVVGPVPCSVCVLLFLRI